MSFYGWIESQLDDQEVGLIPIRLPVPLFESTKEIDP